MVHMNRKCLAVASLLLFGCNGNIGDGSKPNSGSGGTSQTAGDDPAHQHTTPGEAPSTRRPTPTGSTKTVYDDAPDNAWIDTGLDYHGGNEVPAVFDQKNQLFFKYGGCGDATPPVNISFPQGDPRYPNGYSNTLWALDIPSQTWQLRRQYDASWPTDRPANGCTRSYVYDSNRKVIWMYGGISDGGGGGYLWDLWSYDSTTDTFAQLHTANAPPPAQDGSDSAIIVYDPVNDVIVMPKGATTWVLHFDNNTWEERSTPNGPPAAGHYSSMIFEPTLGKILFPLPVRTGNSSTTLTPDMDPDHWRPSDTGYLEYEFQTWTYDAATNDWEELHPQQSPTPAFRAEFGLTFDTKNKVSILIGGSSCTWDDLEQDYNDLWVYHADQNTWLKRNPPGQLPSADRDARQAAYSEAENAVIYMPRAGHVWVYRYQ